MANTWRTRADWYPAVGRFMLAFGDIEHGIARAIVRLQQEPDHVAISEMEVQARLNLLARTVAAHPTANTKAMRSVLGGIEKLIRPRHLVAHNGIYFFLSQAGGDDHLAIVSLRNIDRRLRFEDLIDLAQKAEDLSQRLDQLTAP